MEMHHEQPPTDLKDAMCPVADHGEHLLSIEQMVDSRTTSKVCTHS